MPTPIIVFQGSSDIIFGIFDGSGEVFSEGEVSSDADARVPPGAWVFFICTAATCSAQQFFPCNHRATRRHSPAIEPPFTKTDRAPREWRLPSGIASASSSAIGIVGLPIAGDAAAGGNQGYPDLVGLTEV